MNSVLSEDAAKFVVKTCKSVTSLATVGRLPLAIPSTSATLAIVIEDSPTTVILPYVGSLDLAGLLNWTRLFTFTSPLPGNTSLLALVTVLTPPEAAVTVAIPTKSDGDWITSALNVPAAPTVPSSVANTDFTSEIPYAVTAIATLPFWTPLNINASFSIKSPSLS